MLETMQMVVRPGLYTSSWQLDALAQRTGQGRRCQCEPTPCRQCVKPGREESAGRDGSTMHPSFVRSVLSQATGLVHS